MSVDILDRRHAFGIFWTYLTFVVYGSLVPFDYRDHTLDEAIRLFARIGYLNLGVASRADWVANIVLYVPLAFLACAWLGGLRARGLTLYLSILGSFVLCLTVAVAVEFTQIFFAPRTVSLNDLLAETLGVLGGTALWVFGRRRIAGLGEAFGAGGRSSILAAIIAYGLLYVALALFPYDFIVSLTEWDWKLATNHQSWLIAGDCASGWRCVAQWAGEALAIAPLGILTALAALGFGWRRAFVAGMALGLVLELLQLLIASGVSQGLSVLLRGAGLAGGFVLGLVLHRYGSMPIARWIWRMTPFAALPYFGLLTVLAGWYAASWLPAGEALAHLADARFMPFYYHYYSTEPAAMASLLANAGMYVPAGLALWARQVVELPLGRRSAWGAALTAAALALIIELGKLWVPGKHPDFTNLLIAAAGAALIVILAGWVERVLASRRVRPMKRAAAVIMQTVSVHPFPPTPSRGGEGEPDYRLSREIPSPLAKQEGWSEEAEPLSAEVPSFMEQSNASLHPLGVFISGVALFITLVGLANYPVGLPWLALALLGYGVLLWRRPSLWLFIVPFLLPVLDLSPFTGRLLLDEFDLLVLITLAAGYGRFYGVQPRPWPHRVFSVAVTLLWVSWGIAMTRGLWPLLSGEDNLLASSHSPLEAWQVGKGLLWALLLVPLLRRTPAASCEVAQDRFLKGVITGLIVVTWVVLWQRHIFVGLGDFENVFRVTGTFSSMHTGGAYIEAFIAFAFPVLAVSVLIERNRMLKLAGLFTAALTSYAMLVTFSRGGYAALIVGLIVVAWGMLGSRGVELRHQGLAFAGLVAVAIIVAVPVLSGGFAQYRLARAAEDLAFRENHWVRALGLMDGGAATVLTGMGLGQYPTRYLFGVNAGKPPGTFSVLREGDNPYLRLGAGETVFLDQWVRVRPGERYTLSARVRQPQGEGSLTIPLCEKALLYSFACSWYQLDPETPGEGWSTMSVAVETGKLGRGGNWPYRPVKLSLHNSGSHQPIDVDEVSFKAADGRELLANGDFSAGVKRWLFVTDQDLAWHIHQQWVELYFTQGMLGILAMVMLLFSVARVLWPAVRAGNPQATALADALAAFLTVGLLGSTLDTARLSMLFYLGAFCGGVLTCYGKSKRIWR